MKINLLETHDRLLNFKKTQSGTISQGAEDCLKKNPLSLMLQQRCPYVYIFAHPRTADDGSTVRMLWQPRITRPKAQTNSYLFRAISNTDKMEICWLLPPRELWPQYEKGKITENETVLWSVDQFLNNRKALEAPLEDDISEEKFKLIMIDIAREVDEQKRMEKLYLSNRMDSLYSSK